MKNIIVAPTSSSALAMQRKGDVKKSLNDLVEGIYVQMWDFDWFRNLNIANNNESTVEGSIAIDDALASKAVKDFAANDPTGLLAPVTNAKLIDVQRAIKVARRRYGIARQVRGNTAPSN